MGTWSQNQHMTTWNFFLTQPSILENCSPQPQRHSPTADLKPADPQPHIPLSFNFPSAVMSLQYTQLTTTYIHKNGLMTSYVRHVTQNEFFLSNYICLPNIFPTIYGLLGLFAAVRAQKKPSLCRRDFPA